MTLGRGLFLAAALLAFRSASPARAQDPRPPGDTAAVVLDSTTVAQDTVTPDSLIAAPTIPDFPPPQQHGYWAATWEWSREDLQRYHGASLYELLMRIPGVVITRPGGFGQPGALAPFGLGGGRARLFVDGWEVDPLSLATPDIQQISPVDVERLRVERHPHEVRVYLTSFRLRDRRTFSQVEAGTGEPDRRILRGLYAQPVGQRGVFTGAFDISDVAGRVGREPFATTTAVLRYDRQLTSTAGVQVSFRYVDIERPALRGTLVGRPPVRSAEEFAERSELLVRGRWRPSDALAVELFGGRLERSRSDSTERYAPVTVGQVGARAMATRGGAWLLAEARARNEVEGVFPAPTFDASARGGMRAAPFLEVEGEARTSLLLGVSGVELRAGARLGGVTGPAAFASVGGGSRPLGYLSSDSVVTREIPPKTDGGAVTTVTDTLPRFAAEGVTTTHLRVGAEWRRASGTIGAALLRVDAASLAPFGFRFEGPRGLLTAEPLTGAEAYLSTRLWRTPLTLGGGYTRWAVADGQLLVPEDEGRASLEFHGVYYTGNLEPTFRLDVIRRGPALVLTEETDPVPNVPFTLFNFSMQVRVIDIRAFFQVENLFNLRVAEEVPGRPIPATRLIYGVRWHFWN